MTKGNAVYNVCINKAKCNDKRVCVKRHTCIQPEVIKYDKEKDLFEYYELRDKFNRGEL
jgi:hypothetical protein